MAYVGNPVGATVTGTPKPAPNPLGGIITDPNVVLAGLARNHAQQQADAVLRQQRSQSLIGFGSPQLAQSLGTTVDPNTAAAAGANQYSTLADLAHQNAIAGRQLLNNLAGRGLAHSGDLGYQEGEQARNYGQSLYNAHNTLLEQLNQQLGAYLGSQQGANSNYLNSILGSYGKVLQNPAGLNGG